MHLQKKIIPFATFVVIASPQMFELTRKILGGWVASAEGVPKTAGLLFHALVFVLVSHFLWKAFFGNTRDVSSCGCSA
jgi:hypothetical protein